MRSFIVKENGLAITFGIRNDLVVELLDFSTEAESRAALNLPDAPHPVMEVQITGTSTRAMHGYKHNMEGASLDFHYDRHDFHEYDNGRELLIHMKTDYQLEAVYHMRFYNGVPVVRTWADLTNRGTEDVGLEYVSSFIYQGICGNGEKTYYDKTDIYVPNNSWASEAQWVCHDARDLNLSGMTVNGFNLPGFGNNRFWYGSSSSWSTCEYLPMGFAANRETDEMYCFQIESSGQWHAEYGSGAQRMDYSMLRLLSLQSTSDQTDAIHNAYIAANVASAVTPEQAGMWVFPYKTDEEHVIWNMVNGLLLRPYISGKAVSVESESGSMIAFIKSIGTMVVNKTR